MVFMTTSCVTKKKYEDMVNSKNKKIKKLKSNIKDREGKIVDLKKSLDDTYAEYNEVKNELIENNAQKTSAIDSLKNSIRGLSSDTSALNQELSKAIDLFNNEKDKQALLTKEQERLNKELEKKNQRLKELEEMIESNKRQVNELKETVSKALVSFEGSDLTVHQKNGKVYVSLEEKLLFKSGSYNVDKKGVEALKKLAVVLEKNPDIDITIEGHTDTIGKAKYNWDLSVKRATAIVDILQKNSSVEPKRFTAAGRGMYLPLDDGTSKEALAKNRRTEIILMPKLNKLYEILDEDVENDKD